MSITMSSNFSTHHELQNFSLHSVDPSKHPVSWARAAQNRETENTLVEHLHVHWKPDPGFKNVGFEINLQLRLVLHLVDHAATVFASSLLCRVDVKPID